MLHEQNSMVAWHSVKQMVTKFFGSFVVILPARSPTTTEVEAEYVVSSTL